MCDYSLHAVAARPPRLETHLSQSVFQAHPRVALLRGKSGQLLYVFSLELNSRSRMTSNIIALTYLADASRPGPGA